MIAARFDEHARYAPLHPLFNRAFAWLAAADLAVLGPGRHDIDDDRLFVLVDVAEGRGQAGARLEVHRQHIDIQLTLEGVERIGWRPLAECRDLTEPYDPERDVAFYGDRPETWLVLPQAHFAIFLPDDAHAPLAGDGLVRKAVVKIRWP